MEINKFYCMDNVVGLKLMSSESVDLTVTSPPYGEIRDYEGYSWDFQSLAKELYRVTKLGGVVVWVVGDQTIKGSESGASFEQALYFKSVGFNLHDTMIYEKSGFRFPSLTRYNQIFEYMFVFSKGKPKSINLISDRKNIYAGAKIARKNSIRQPNGEIIENSAYRLEKSRKILEYGVRSNIWRCSSSSQAGNKLALQHPATFPESLARDHIISWSNSGDLVLDPFMGSGTVGIQAKILGRNFIGFDISQKYVDLSYERLNGETNND